ncbi:MAG: hypothetical protein AAGB05_01460 [Pseudomonadota bacterium]
MTTRTSPDTLLWPFAGADAPSATETGGTPPRRSIGPVLMGDIHGSLGGRPLLLLLWEKWEQEASDPEE